jgi:hypothetical protein
MATADPFARVREHCLGTAGITGLRVAAPPGAQQAAVVELLDEAHQTARRR